VLDALYVEGDFIIKIDDTVYFEEEYFPLSEFYLYLHDWKKKTEIWKSPTIRQRPSILMTCRKKLISRT